MHVKNFSFQMIYRLVVENIFYCLSKSNSEIAHNSLVAEKYAFIDNALYKIRRGTSSLECVGHVSVPLFCAQQL